MKIKFSSNTVLDFTAITADIVKSDFSKLANVGQNRTGEYYKRSFFFQY